MKKNWPPFKWKSNNRQQNIVKKGEKLLLRSNFSSFSTIFSKSLRLGVKLTYSFLTCGCSIYFFLHFANLISRGTDISKYFREFLGLQDNESRLYVRRVVKYFFSPQNICYGYSLEVLLSFYFCTKHIILVIIRIAFARYF